MPDLLSSSWEGRVDVNWLFIIKKSYVKVKFKETNHNNNTKSNFISIDFNIKNMSKWKASNSVLTIDQVMNDIDTWLVDKDCDQNEIEDDLDELCGS